MKESFEWGYVQGSLDEYEDWWSTIQCGIFQGMIGNGPRFFGILFFSVYLVVSDHHLLSSTTTWLCLAAFWALGNTSSSECWVRFGGSAALCRFRAPGWRDSISPTIGPSWKGARWKIASRKRISLSVDPSWPYTAIRKEASVFTEFWKLPKRITYLCLKERFFLGGGIWRSTLKYFDTNLVRL